MVLARDHPKLELQMFENRICPASIELIRAMPCFFKPDVNFGFFGKTDMSPILRRGKKGMGKNGRGKKRGKLNNQYSLW